MGEHNSHQNIRGAWKVLLTNALAVGLSTGLENVAILYTSISLNQAIKASLPAFAMVASFYLEGRTYAPVLIGLNLVMIIGVTLALLHNPSFTMAGFLCSIGACNNDASLQLRLADSQSLGTCSCLRVTALRSHSAQAPPC